MDKDELMKEGLEAEKKLREKRKEEEKEKKEEIQKGILLPGEIALMSNQLAIIWNELMDIWGKINAGKKVNKNDLEEIRNFLENMESKVRFTELYTRWKEAMRLVEEIEKLL